MPEMDPYTDDADAPASHRAPRAGLGKRWAVGAAGVAVLAVGLLISPALGSDDDPAPIPTPTPTASPSAASTAKPSPTPSATASLAPRPASSVDEDDKADAAVVAKRMDHALKVVREKADQGAEAVVEPDDSGTITIVTDRADDYTGTTEDLVSSLLDAIEAEIDVDVVPAAPGVTASVDLQPIAINLGLG